MECFCLLGIMVVLIWIGERIEQAVKMMRVVILHVFKDEIHGDSVV